MLSPALAVDAAALTRRLVAIGLVETQAAEALRASEAASYQGALELERRKSEHANQIAEKMRAHEERVRGMGELHANEKREMADFQMVGVY